MIKKKRGIKPGTPSPKRGMKYSNKQFEWRKLLSFEDALKVNRFVFASGIMLKKEFDERNEYIRNAQKIKENKN